MTADIIDLHRSRQELKELCKHLPGYNPKMLEEIAQSMNALDHFVSCYIAGALVRAGVPDYGPNFDAAVRVHKAMFGRALVQDHEARHGND